jgi:hypothetical protein
MSSTRLTGTRFVSVLALPWLFVALFAWLVVTFLLPRVLEGQVLAIIFGVLVVSALTSFTFAAVTFSRDVLVGRYPSQA